MVKLLRAQRLHFGCVSLFFLFYRLVHHFCQQEQKWRLKERGLDSSEAFTFLQVFIKHTRTPSATETSHGSQKWQKCEELL